MPSYPKETPDQWPPIAGDLSGWGGACNQSINNGCSLRERHNQMRQTHTHPSPFIWLPPSFCLLHKLLLDPFLLVLFSAPLCHSVPSSSPPSCPNPPPLTSPKFQGDGTHKSKECSWTGVEEEDGDRRWWTQGWGSWGWGTGRLMAHGQHVFWWAIGP